MKSRALRRQFTAWMCIAALGCAEDSGTISDDDRDVGVTNQTAEEAETLGADTGSRPADGGGMAGRPAAAAEVDDEDAMATDTDNPDPPDRDQPVDEEPQTAEGAAPQAGSENSDEGVMDSVPDPDTLSPVQDGEPVFVAVGDGGFFATSCDRGQTWKTQTFAGTLGDHSPWTAFAGIAHGAHGFVAGFGWGSGGHIAQSATGLGFEELPGSAFAGGSYGQPTAAVAYTGSEYLLFNSKFSSWTSSDGRAFQQSDIALPGSADQIRQLRAFPAADGLIVAAVENQSGKDHPAGNFVLTSEDGVEWVEGEGFEPNCASRMQIAGGDIAYHNGILLVGGEQHCRSTDRGATFSQVEKPGSDRTTDLFVDANGFIALAGQHAYHSTDGTSWKALSDVGGSVFMGDYGAGAYAAVSRDGKSFYYSEDGKSWSQGKLSGPSSETTVRDFFVGYYDPACP